MENGLAAIVLIAATLDELGRKNVIDQQSIGIIYQEAIGTLEQSQKMQQSPEIMDAQKILQTAFSGRFQK
jgi:hypothetical protein